MIFVDTAPFIYFFEENEEYIEQVDCLFNTVTQLDVQLVTSMVTYIELLTLPVRTGDTRLSAKYRDFLTNSEGVSIYPLNFSVADATIDFRAKYGLGTADAIQLATAQDCGADYVITNDRSWQRVSELDIVLVSDLPGPLDLRSSGRSVVGSTGLPSRSATKAGHAVHGEEFTMNRSR
jgi:predicted nucleic acid-binding protein